MYKVKTPSVAGTFYPENKEELLSQIADFKKNLKKHYTYTSRAVIVPHAGYYYSGQLAFEGLNCLDKKVENIFIFAPAHRVFVEGAALSGFDAWETPLGDVELNKEINNELNEKFGCGFYNEAFKDEHAIEVQLPLLQKTFEYFKIIPVLVGREKASKITEIISHYWGDEKNAFVISSDLSHFLSSPDAKKVDLTTAQMIEEVDMSSFHPEQACGSVGICGLCDFAGLKGYSLIRVGMLNSGDISGDNSRVVGYGSWLLYEGEKNKFIKEYFSDFVLDTCRKSIEYDGKYSPENYAPVFDELGACFVTLEIGGNLRGCIGSILAYEPLVDNLVKNAYNSAFSDPRFPPVSKEEFLKTELKVSILSAPVKMKFKDENDLLSQIVPFVDGLIIKDGRYQAVYLPSVWEQLPDKEDFLDSLKQKSGLPRDYFSETFEAFRFGTEYIF